MCRGKLFQNHLLAVWTFKNSMKVVWILIVGDRTDAVSSQKEGVAEVYASVLCSKFSYQ